MIIFKLTYYFTVRLGIYLFNQQQMFSSLGHWTICSSHHQNSTIYLRCSNDHVFDKISMSGAVNMGIFTLWRFITYMSYIYSYTSSFLFRSLIDFIISYKTRQTILFKYLGDCCCQCSFSMINVSNCTYLYHIS